MNKIKRATGSTVTPFVSIIGGTGLDPATLALKNDDNRYKTHLKTPFGEKEPRELAPLDIDRLRLKHEKTHAAGTTLSVLSLLRRIASFGVKRQLCDGLRFKIDLKELTKKAKMKTEDMTPEQMAAYRKKCEEWKNRQVGNICLLAYLTGLRRGEIQNLKWNDINFTRGVVEIRDPKGGTDQILPLSGEALEVLRDHPRTGEYVFTGEQGGRILNKMLNKESRAIRDAVGLPKDFRPLHGLRHTFGSHLASSGEVDLYILQRLMTHKSPLMTQRYAHLRDETLRRGAEVMGKIGKSGTRTP